jgi:hypothetical protein
MHQATNQVGVPALSGWARPWSRRWCRLPAALALLVAACSSAATDTADRQAQAEVTSQTEVAGQTGATGAPAANGGAGSVSSGLPLLESGQVVPANLAGPTAEMVTLQESPYIGAAVYPRPDHEGKPWSQWGQGIALDDGRVISAMGDHLGADGNSYLFVYDPEARTVTRFADVLSAVPHQPGDWGYGKVHSQMVDAGDGGVYFTTYYGTRTGLAYEGTYSGDVLFRLDQTTLDLQPVSVPVPGHGIASLATNGNGLLYAEPIDPLVNDDVYPVGGAAVIDTANGSVTSFADDPARDIFRNVMVGLDGTAWFAGDNGSLFRYDPAGGQLALDDAVLPASLRASTLPATDGTIYGATMEPYRFFAFTPDGSIQDLGPAKEYVSSMALLPDESAFLYVPGGHGDAPLFNSPLISVDTKTGEQTTIVELLDLAREKLGLVLGGTYSITLDSERNQAHIAFNAGPSVDEPWGDVVLVVVELP